LGVRNLDHDLLGVTGHPGEGVFRHRFALRHQPSYLFGALGCKGQEQLCPNSRVGSQG
jgi:hypothetical protein